MKHKPLRDQTIVVTGASSGIGLATARMAAERGAGVVLVARSGDALARIAGEIERTGGRAIPVTADVGDRAQVEAAAARAIEAFGGFDTWVNVAGLTIYGPLRTVAQEDHERLMRTNFWGTVNGSLVAVEHLAQRGGALINVGSVASDLAFPFQGLYSASKHAVKGFTDALRMELRQEDGFSGAPVSVTLVKPTSIDTPLPRRARNYMDREPMLPRRSIGRRRSPTRSCTRPCTRSATSSSAGQASCSPRPRRSRRAPSIGSPPRSSPSRSAAGSRAVPEGALHAPEPDDTGHARGDQPGYVMRTSAYTRASLHPWGAAAAMVGLGLATAALLAPGRPGRRTRPF